MIENQIVIGIRYYFFCFLFVGISCKTLHVGGGVSYDSGTSGGCEAKSGISGQLFTEYYFTSQDGFGIALEMGPLGYSDCNDGDPLIHVSPLLRYKKELSSDLYFIPTAGYTFGPFVDEGWLAGSILRLHAANHLFLETNFEYYSAFKEKENAVLPGKSQNFAFKINIGYAF